MFYTNTQLSEDTLHTLLFLGLGNEEPTTATVVNEFFLHVLSCLGELSSIREAMEDISDQYNSMFDRHVVYLKYYNVRVNYTSINLGDKREKTPR